LIGSEFFISVTTCNFSDVSAQRHRQFSHSDKIFAAFAVFEIRVSLPSFCSAACTMHATNRPSIDRRRTTPLSRGLGRRDAPWSGNPPIFNGVQP
jgi:hypothetical protein